MCPLNTKTFSFKYLLKNLMSSNLENVVVTSIKLQISSLYHHYIHEFKKYIGDLFNINSKIKYFFVFKKTLFLSCIQLCISRTKSLKRKAYSTKC